MSIDLQAVLNNKAINQWRLFWLISAPISIVMVIAMLRTDMSTGPGVSTMIQFSVRWAVPFLFLVVASSSVYVLFPGPFSMWWLRNQKHLGLCFAVAMGWQGLFIFIMSNFYRDYYFADVYLLRDELEGSVGYILLAVMVVTSFTFGRKHLNSKQWKLLHRSGIYFLFGYAFSVYWWNLSYYENPQLIDYVFYWGGFLAFTLRIAAWAKKRRQAVSKRSTENGTPIGLKMLGGAMVAFGLLISATGLYWQKPVTAFLTEPKWSSDLLLWLPFWPFEPFLSLFVIGMGALVATKTNATVIQATVD